MAKTLLKDGALDCSDLSNEDDQQCIMETILREIVNGQNHQIQKMKRYLDAYGFPETDNCVIEIETGDKTIEGPADYDRDNGIIAGSLNAESEADLASPALFITTGFSIVATALIIF